MNNKFILNFTPTGIIPTKKMTPYVPVSPDEIINDVITAANLGANMVHLHARDPKTGKPVYQKEVYAEIIRGIKRKYKNLVVCVSTSGRVFHDFKKRSDCLQLEGDLKPDFASLTLSSLNFNKEASINSPQIIQELARLMLEKGIRPEMEVFDLGMINYARYLIGKGLIKPPYYFSIILGNIACAQADITHLGLMIKELPEGSLWSVGGVGNSQLAMNIMALTAGGGVRIGLEDNIWYDTERTRLATNHDLVKRVLTIAGAMGKQPLDIEETRNLLGL
ncbi:MAG: 3-keto-5-aminohexanoate cleavage protein [Dehalococcoidales bacterium]|nr:3-keto-5-aminohexanoate cleavage protein [Dehalococcoidales bacterium]